MRGKITAVAVGGMLAAGLPAGVARAEPGVTVDPQSPAGVEYAVPLDSGRGLGGGHRHTGGASGGTGGGSGDGSSNSGGGSGGSSSSSSSSSNGLFGAGITPPRQGGTGGRNSGSKPAHGRGGGSASHGRTSHDPATGGSDATPAGVTPVRAAASYSTTAPLAGLIGAVVLIGGGIGLLLRFRTRSR
jgi:hypothetical protein